MLVSGVRGSGTSIGCTGFRWASDDVYLLWRSCNFELQIVHLCSRLPLPFPPSWLVMVSKEAGKYLLWVSQCLVVVAAICIAMDTCVPCERLPQSHLLPMSLSRQQWESLKVLQFVSTKHGNNLTYLFWNPVCSFPCTYIRGKNGWIPSF